MKKHLGEYVLFQLEQGYDLPDIKSALIRFGYKKPVVKEILNMLHITTPRKKPAMYSAHDLDQELKVYVQSLLIDYIVKEHKVGYPLEAIKKALINFGHDPSVIDEAILIIESGKVVDYRLDASPVKFPQQIVAPLTIFLIFSFIWDYIFRNVVPVRLAGIFPGLGQAARLASRTAAGQLGRLFGLGFCPRPILTRPSLGRKLAKRRRP